jgi:hypothetical protein
MILLESSAMRFKMGALILIAVVAAVTVWQCFTWPAVEMSGRWVNEQRADEELKKIAQSPIRHPPSPMEIAVRVTACAIGVLLGVALTRVVRRH